MTASLFSYCPQIIGKDKTEVPHWSGKGTQQKWSLYRNRFKNHKSTVLSEADGAVVLRDFNRQDFINLVAVQGFATAYVLQNDTLMTGRAAAPNVLGANHLMLDFDNTMSMDDVMKHEWYKKVYFLYSTPSFGLIQEQIPEKTRIKYPEIQLQELDKQIGKQKRNFRLVFKFSRFVTSSEIPEIAAGMMSLFPMADQSCRDAARLMFGSVDAFVEHPEDEYELTNEDLSKLKALGEQWSESNRKSQKKRLESASSSATLTSGEYSYETEITLASGEVFTVQDLLEQQPLGFHERCYSPFRPEDNPSAFVKKWEEGGNLFVYDSGGDEKYTWLNKERDKLILKLSEKKVKEKEAPREQIDPRRVFTAPSNDTIRKKTVRDFVHTMLSLPYDHGVLVTAEGYGKSTELVAELTRQNRMILFCCLSHKQCSEKMESFKMYDPVHVWSVPGLIEDRLGFKAPLLSNSDPFNPNKGLDVEKALRMIMSELNCSCAEAQEVLDDFKEVANASQSAPSNILITSFTLGSMLFAKTGGKTDRIIIVDDPGMSDLVRFKYEFQSGDDVESAMPQVTAERQVQDLIFGPEFQYQDKIIWTTTESLVADCICLQHPSSFKKEVIENIETDRNILIIPSNKMTRRALKPILPGIHEVIQQDLKLTQYFFANGVKGEYNLVNIKGRNDLRADAVIVISYPHPCDAMAVMSTLELESQNEATRRLVVAQLNQAIGRSQGYRDQTIISPKVLVICDSALESNLISNCRYRLNTIEGLKRRGRLHGVPIVWADDQPQWWSEWFSYLNTWEKYVIKIGDHIFNTLTLEKMSLGSKDYEVLSKQLDKPTQFTNLLWKKHSEIIEGDTCRNFSKELSELVSQFSKSTQAESVKTSNKSRYGSRKYKCEITGQTGMYIPGTEPVGYTQVRNRHNK